jgi:hypothetical protein
MNNHARAAEIALRQISSLFRHDKKPWPFRAAQRHQRVYLSFVRQAGGAWNCRFHKDDLAKTPISKLFFFRDATKIVEIVRRGRGLTGMESRQTIDEAVALGRGGIFLELDANQFQALRRQS